MASGMDQSSIAKFNAVLRKTALLSKRPASEVVKQGYIHFLQSGRANTKLGKAKRAIVDNKNYDKRNPGTKPYFIVFLHQKRGPKYVPTDSKSDPRRRIRRRGLARQTWNWMFAGIAPAGQEAAYHGKTRPGTIVKVSSNIRPVRPSVEYANKLRYMEISNPRIHEVALGKASRRMQKLLDLNIKSRFERTWA